MSVDSELRKGRRRHALAGLLFSLFLMALVLLGIVGLAVLKSAGTEYTIHFKDAKALGPGDKVVLDGFVIGEVRRVELAAPGQVNVEVKIDKKYASMVLQGATAMISSPTFPNVSGQRVVEIHNPADEAAPVLPEGSSIEGVEHQVALQAWKLKSELDTMGGTVSEKARSTLDALKIKLEELKDIPESPEVKEALEKIGEMTTNLRDKGKEGLEILDREWEELSERLGPQIEKLKEVSKEKAGQALDAAKEKLGDAASQLRERLSGSENKGAETPEPTPPTLPEV